MNKKSEVKNCHLEDGFVGVTPQNHAPNNVAIDYSGQIQRVYGKYGTPLTIPPLQCTVYEPEADNQYMCPVVLAI
jgi:hypothetical protein